MEVALYAREGPFSRLRNTCASKGGWSDGGLDTSLCNLSFLLSSDVLGFWLLRKLLGKYDLGDVPPEKEKELMTVYRCEESGR